MAEVKPSIEPRGMLYLNDIIIDQLERRGFARFDCGIFRLYRRKAGKIKILHGKRKGKFKMTKPYATVFFRVSNDLRRRIARMEKDRVKAKKRR